LPYKSGRKLEIVEQDPIVKQTGEKKEKRELYFFAANAPLFFFLKKKKKKKPRCSSLNFNFFVLVAAIIELSKFKLAIVANTLGYVLESVSKVNQAVAFLIQRVVQI
jgi:hypothetical protein